MKPAIICPLLICLSLSACGLFQGKPTPIEQEEEEPSSRYIGQIASVHEDQGFVLIRRSPGIQVATGTILISDGTDGRAANLRATGESLGQMIAADLQSGTPQVGDSVREPLIEEVELEADLPEQESQVTDNQ